MELLLIAVGLSMDAFAVALCKGLGMKKLNYGQGLIIGLFFGVFQGAMPLLGWVLGKQFEAYIVPVDHWIAFVLLSYIGGRMLYGALTGKEESQESAAMDAPLDYRELFMLSVATSIDALAVGITFAFLHIKIIPAVCLIGSITFALSFVGVIVGHHMGLKYKAKAEIAGGVTLILIGIKILLEHLGIL